MTGTILNGLAILLGGILGLTVARQLSAQTQNRIKVFLGVFIVYVGFSTTWKSVNGSFGQIVWQVVLIMVSLVLGNLIGKKLGLQTRLSKQAQFAKDRIQGGDPAEGSRLSDGFLTCTLLFCVGPMAILGAIQDGSAGNYKILAIKSVMDGLATMAFSKTFGWGVMLSALPVVAYQGSIALAARMLTVSQLDQNAVDAMNATGGLLIITISLVVLEIKKVPLADYLPSLLVAPVLGWLLR